MLGPFFITDDAFKGHSDSFNKFNKDFKFNIVERNSKVKIAVRELESKWFHPNKVQLPKSTTSSDLQFLMILSSYLNKKDIKNPIDFDLFYECDSLSRNDIMEVIGFNDIISRIPVSKYFEIESILDLMRSSKYWILSSLMYFEALDDEEGVGEFYRIMQERTGGNNFYFRYYPLIPTYFDIFVCRDFCRWFLNPSKLTVALSGANDDIREYVRFLEEKEVIEIAPIRSGNTGAPFYNINILDSELISSYKKLKEHVIKTYGTWVKPQVIK